MKTDVFSVFFTVFGGDADSEKLETAMLPLGWLVICVSARPREVFLGISCIFFINKILGGLGGGGGSYNTLKVEARAPSSTVFFVVSTCTAVCSSAFLAFPVEFCCGVVHFFLVIFFFFSRKAINLRRKAAKAMRRLKQPRFVCSLLVSSLPAVLIYPLVIILLGAMYHPYGVLFLSTDHQNKKKLQSTGQACWAWLLNKLACNENERVYLRTAGVQQLQQLLFLFTED